MVRNSLIVLLRRRSAAAALAIAAVISASAVPAQHPIIDQRLADIDSRLMRLEGILDNKVLLDILRRIETLQGEIQALRDTTDRVGYEMEEVKDRQRELYLNIDRRLRALETARPEPAVGGSEAAQTTAAGRPNDAIPASAAAQMAGGELTGDITPGRQAADTDAYRDAFNLLKAGRYEDSIAAFNQFLTNYPNSSYAANAQYWLAEAYYVLGNYDLAATDFNKVIKRYPQSAKVPDARLKLGFTHYELQQWEQARAVLSELNKQYPNTTVAQLAANRLQRMTREGH
jgi:tol-pal system protein YbgF